MSAHDDGGPAFPRDHANDGHNGMTLRDYFAGKAVQGMLADQTMNTPAEEFAERAYAIADAMLKARQP
jgi:hypothetical protein